MFIGGAYPLAKVFPGLGVGFLQRGAPVGFLSAFPLAENHPAAGVDPVPICPQARPPAITNLLAMRER